ncbi:hypothetical protein C5Y96_13000 [Blastopirellula marina]|uniref:STAS/SEC14 domain-containing protein n=1 Tax=Blastopirellula marina TaxID=124 RepID=A0A2S8FGI0_9BACT|nr:MULTISPECIES: hypothetical protein [Pirellulaceae]PQO31256.1 hypothetical protein C5Y96_13000 [Blastopirellula marina]RCS51650.1 hypothetical protein DTL36_13010 [Bremerella cremea]
MSKYEHPYTEHDEYLEFVVSGTAKEEDFFSDLLCAMVEATEQTGKRRIFIDRSAADPQLPVEPMVIYRMSLRMAEAFGASVRIAALSSSMESQSFWEDVSTNRGSIVKAGSDRDSLIQWLLQDN